MEIAILGGTGDIGEGLALRWGEATDHTIRIGSRKEQKATEAADSYRNTLEARGRSPTIMGGENRAITEGADLVLLCAPPYHVRDLVETISPNLGSDAVLVTPAVGIKKNETGFHLDSPPQGSVTELVAEVAPAENPVIGAYHNLPANRLGNLDAELGLDTVVIGDDAAAKQLVMDVTGAIPGMRAVDAGPLANAAEAEGLAPLLINIAEYTDEVEQLGVRFR